MKYYNGRELSIIKNELIEREMFTESELDLLLNINGFNSNTFDDMIHFRYGYHLDDFAEEIMILW